MTPVHFSLTPLALAALLMTAGSAMAQSADAPADTEPMATVVVTASADASAQGLPSAYAGGQVARGGRIGLLGNVDMMDTPFNTTNYTLGVIQDQQARSVADVVQNDPSVRVARGSGNFQELYVIRGFAVNSDDLAYNGLFGLLPRQFVAAELLERVEVFRGASAFVNGAAPGGGGIGGTINLLPKRAASRPLTQVTVGVESGGQAYVAADVSRRFGEEERLGLRVNAAHREGDTAVDRESRKLDVIAVGMDYRGDGYRLSADIGYQDHSLNSPRPNVTLLAAVPMIAPPSPTSNFAQPWTVSSEHDTFGTVRGEVDLAQDVVAWAAFGARSGDEYNELASPRVSNADGTTSMSRFDNVRHDKVRTGEVGVRGMLRTGGVKHTVSATASAFSLDSRNGYATGPAQITNIYRPVDYPSVKPTPTVGGSMTDPLLTATSDLASYAIADTLAMLDDSVLLTVGVRHQRIRSGSFSYTTGARIGRYDETASTPVAGLVYKPVKGVSLYANYIEALQPGPVAAGTDIDNVGEAFAPYRSRQKEVGVKYDAGKLGMSAALFTVAQPSAYVVNRHFGVFGEQRNRGLELSVFGVPTRGVRVLGGLTLLDTEQVSTLNGVNQGKDAIGVPKTQLNLGSEWDVPYVDGLTLDARAVYTASQFADGANTKEVPSWSRFDLGASYAMRVMERAVTLRARVNNVADRSYWASAGGFPGSGYLVVGAPRTFTLSGTVNF
ncbi:TonB-dependent siderophore receptor [Massilia sp. YIM B02769]|uniref:TonB-dependent receptor n=1 Tax=unclassified Massilia TaxID=2609279 RepID=UPI0025B68241|nr:MULTISPECIES: TonB-dependent siderophore receptor [unclassified Massilia]MDN4060665.1 TonB-dependent siderophore receptor [Massilia sp. YIM B02769]